MRSILSRERRDSRGFSLLEVIVALAIMGAGIVALMQLFSVSLRNTKRTEEYTKGLLHARTLMEMAYSAENAGEAAGDYDLGDGYRGKIVVNPVTSDEGTALEEITVTVLWPPAGKTELKGKRVFHEKKEEDAE